MESIINSFLLVAVSEIGDKTQLLSFVLASRFKKPWPIIWGILIATILNHGLASYLGVASFNFIPLQYHKWILSLTFLVFGFWILIPDKEEEVQNKGKFGPFLTSLILFFIAEMGDKTQLATIALGAQYQSTWAVTVGTTLGMMAANVPAVFLGDKILKKVPLNRIRQIAFVLFLLFALYIALV